MAQGTGLRRINTIRAIAWSLAAAALLVPLVAMGVTDEVNWGAEDFLAAALLIGGAGLSLELVVRFIGGATPRIAAALAVAAVFLVIWAQLAVGILP